MSRTQDTGPAAAAQAIDRVLGAEHDAQAHLEQARQQAREALEDARQDALASVNRALDRIAAWQQGHAAALERRLADHRARAQASANALQPPDEAAVAAAVAHVAARLTGGAAGTDACHGRP